MSKAIKSVASIALPIIGTLVAPGIGTALGSSLSGAALGGIGGALGGAAGGLVSGGSIKGALTGAALGGAGGYISGAGGVANAAQKLGMGTVGHTLGAGVSGPVTQASGLAGMLGNVGSGVSTAANALGMGGGSGGGGISSYLSPAMMLGNAISGVQGVKTAGKAADIQSAAIDKGIVANNAGQQGQQETLAPFVGVGTDAIRNLNTLQADPAGYIRNNPLYNSLADDAQRRLLANQAAKGKVGSGGTAAALQEQLLNLGNGLVQQQVSNYQNQINSGQGAATSTGTGKLLTGQNNANMLGQQGDVNAAGKVGAYNAGNSAYQNTINTLLAMQGLQKSPIYG